MSFADHPRFYWSPVLAREYGVLPWQMRDLTAAEYEDIAADVAALVKAAERG